MSDLYLFCISPESCSNWGLVPPGHVRGRRVSRPVPISSGPSGLGGQLPIEDALPYDPYIPARSPVHVPPDPKGVLDAGHGVRDLLANDTLVIVRYA